MGRPDRPSGIEKITRPIDLVKGVRPAEQVGLNL
jgi:hypothetical protein